MNIAKGIRTRKRKQIKTQPNNKIDKFFKIPLQNKSQLDAGFKVELLRKN